MPLPRPSARRPPLPAGPLPAGSPAGPLPGSSPSGSPGAGGSPGLRVREPGELVAALPSLIGFHPRDSVVLVSMGGPGGRHVDLVVRGDLPEPIPRPHTVRTLVSGLLRARPAAAVVVLVGGAPPGADGRPAGQHRRLVALLEAEITRHGVEVHSVLWASGTRAGARWSCFDPCACVGLVPAQESTALAASAAAAGTVVYADRAELRAMVEPVEPAVLRRRERLIAALVHEAAASGAAPASPVVSDPAAGIELVEAAVAETAAGHLRLDDERVVALATALTIPAVRDHAIDLAAAHGGSGSAAAASEQLWAALTRESPAPEAAEPAVLLAVAALLRGDGALANIALDRAEEAWPGHRFSRLLRGVVDLGMRPEHFRAALRSPGAPG